MSAPRKARPAWLQDHGLFMALMHLRVCQRSLAAARSEFNDALAAWEKRHRARVGGKGR